MPLNLTDQAAIVGIGASQFGRALPESKLELAAHALNKYAPVARPPRSRVLSAGG